MQDAILQVGLGKSSVNLVNLRNLDELWDDAVLGELCLSLLLDHILSLDCGRGGP